MDSEGWLEVQSPPFVSSFRPPSHPPSLPASLCWAAEGIGLWATHLAACYGIFAHSVCASHDWDFSAGGQSHGDWWCHRAVPLPLVGVNPCSLGSR